MFVIFNRFRRLNQRILQVDENLNGDQMKTEEDLPEHWKVTVVVFPEIDCNFE